MLRKLVKYIIVVCQFESFCPMQQKTIPVDKYEVKLATAPRQRPRAHPAHAWPTTCTHHTVRRWTAGRLAMCCLVETFPMPFTDPAGCQGTRVWVGSKAGGWPRTLVVAASVVIRRGSDRPRERGPLPSRCVAAWRAASRWRALARFVTKSARSSPCLSSWSRHRLARTNAHALRV